MYVQNITIDHRKTKVITIENQDESQYQTHSNNQNEHKLSNEYEQYKHRFLNKNLNDKKFKISKNQMLLENYVTIILKYFYFIRIYLHLVNMQIKILKI